MNPKEGLIPERVIMTGNGYDVGWGKPPKSTQFSAGHSGNLKGRPKGSGKKATLPHEDILSQNVMIHENGVSRRERADRAFILFLVNNGIAGCPRIGSLVLQAISKHKRRQPERSRRRLIVFTTYQAEGQVDQDLCELGIAKKLDPYGCRARLLLEPWVVQAALDRFGEKRLTQEEQATIVAATRLPYKVEWPAWWTVSASSGQ